MICSKNYLLVAFNYFDEDKDGAILFQKLSIKFYKVLKKKMKILKYNYEQIDINKVGIISLDEFSSMIKGIMAS